MKKQYLIWICILFGISKQTNGQVYGNEWINYNQNYLKMSVAVNGIYHIDFSELQNAGFNTVIGNDLVLIRDGQQVPIYVSQSGNFTAGDYIEFYGKMADGAVDAPLFKNPTEQINPTQNLIGDTAYYFLTSTSVGTHLRITEIPNNIIGTPSKETYCWNTVNVNFRNSFNGGLAAPSGVVYNPVLYLRSSHFELSEAWCNSFSTATQTNTVKLPGAYKLTGAPSATFNSTIVGFSYLNTHRVKIEIGNTLLGDSTFGSFDSKKYQATFPMSLVPTSGNLALKYTSLNGIASQNLLDRYGVANINIRYPMTFNFNGDSAKYFELDPKATDYYLEIDNFNSGGNTPLLFDIDNSYFLTADISTPNKIKFLIPASTTVKRFQLIGKGSALGYTNVQNLHAVNFKNYTQSANQGNYIILTDPHYYNNGGINYVEQYRQFRSSSAGGNYNAIVADVNQIYNEFGYGYSFHSQAIRNFLHYAYTSPNWNNKAKFVFLIGKGIYYRDYIDYTQDTTGAYSFVPIPTFGSPASDLLLSDFDNTSIPQLNIGRLSIRNGEEVGVYLEKVKLHEQNMSNQNMQYADSILWRKNILHIAGTSDIQQQTPILGYLSSQSNSISDIWYGGKVTTIAKSTSSPVQTASSAIIDNLVNNGVGFIQFFGHGSATTLDFNLDNPENYINNGRFPIFLANGCGVGNVFTMNDLKTLSERWIDAPTSGCIAFVANVNTGITNSLALYSDSLYGQMARTHYGKTIGEQVSNNVKNLMGPAGLYGANFGDFRIHCEQISLQGDPALSMYGSTQPDYAVEDAHLTFKQFNITTAMDSFDVDLIAYNLGKFEKDSIELIVLRTYPSNDTEVVLNKKYFGLSFTDTLNLRIPVGDREALGLNNLYVKIDNQDKAIELSEMNNTLSHNFYIYDDDLVPVYPYEFSIVSEQGVELKASTLNPFLDTRQYLLQIDTTELFNSNHLKSIKLQAGGGLIKWKPNIVLKDSLVYYWRTAMDTLYGNSSHRWTNSSFVFLNQSTPGWNQSHHYQYLKDNLIGINDNSRKFAFEKVNNMLTTNQMNLFGPAPHTYDLFSYWTKLNGSTINYSLCAYSALQFQVIDSITGILWQNEEVLGSGFGKYGSIKPCNGPISNFFEFKFTNPTDRQKAMDFIDSIPNGAYVYIQPNIRLNTAQKNQTFINDWMADTTILGSNKSLYHKIKDIGFTLIDSFVKNRPMVFFQQKGNPLSIKQFVGADSTVVLTEEFTFQSYHYQGKIISPLIGASSQWNNFYRSGISSDITPVDSVSVDIFGVDKFKNEVYLATTYGDTSLSFIDANLYPYIRLVMQQKDSIYSTPEHIKYWRVHYVPLPEAALNPNSHFAFKDTVGQGEIMNMAFAIENLTSLPMDSMLVKYQLIDKNNQYSLLAEKRYAPLKANDTIIAQLPIDSKSLSGDYFIRVEANPNNDQPEQFHPNNIGFKEIYIIGDDKNPVLDVSFDGVHIMNEDVVSSKPHILITVRDENRFLALDDTSSLSVSLRYPSDLNTDVNIPYDNNILKFYPANAGILDQKNEAKIEFNPTLAQDGLYQLVLQGKDKVGNLSSTVKYKVSFKVINKPSISAFLNYPNPFSTSTQFVFTLTGSEVPDDLKIQIMNMSGRVVREITKAELGNIHIGQNISEFKWKGDDQYGDLLGNGLYLYRVVAHLNGKKMDLFSDNKDGMTGVEIAEKYSTKGFGKIYIMR